MICWRVCDVVECFARNSDDVLGNCKVVHGLDREWKLLLRPAEHNLSNLTPFWANGNFGTDSSGVVAKIALCHAFGLIDEEMFTDLEIIRKIRNRFAHEYDN